MKKLWLIFAQTVTIGLAVWFTLTALQPQWFQRVLAVDPAPETATALPPLAREASSVPALGSYRDAAASAQAVVNIYTAKTVRNPRVPRLEEQLLRRFFGESDENDAPALRPTSLGSGVIVSADGYIVTNNHVIEEASQIEVALADGRRAQAELIGTDPDTDLAVIRIRLPNLPVIQLADPAQARVGDVVLAIGNPFGVGQTVTMGIVSALGRSELGINTFENFIQTDAPINPGNSGGALVDTQGRLLGINTAIFSRSGGSLGIGFAIPSTTVNQVMQALIRDGSVARGWLGVEVRDALSDAQADIPPGALIAGVVQGGPAERAGVRPGDILLQLGSAQIRSAGEMLNQVATLAPGATTTLRVWRNGQVVQLEAQLGKRPSMARRQRE